MAYAREEDRVRTRWSGFQIHVPKPVSSNKRVANLADQEPVKELLAYPVEPTMM